MRVTGGQSRGRILKVPDTGTVRPTSDKMRQQLYNMLAHSPWAVGAGFELDGAHVLDGFCGSGALGIEALSRGAAGCFFVDIDGRVLQTTKANVKACGYEPVSGFLIKGCNKLGACPKNLAPRTLVLLDPPYRKDMILPALETLHDGAWLLAGALVVAESEKGWAGAADKFTPLHARAEGDSQLNVWQYAP